VRERERERDTVRVRHYIYREIKKEKGRKGEKVGGCVPKPGSTKVGIQKFKRPILIPGIPSGDPSMCPKPTENPPMEYTESCIIPPPPPPVDDSSYKKMMIDFFGVTINFSNYYQFLNHWRFFVLIICVLKKSAIKVKLSSGIVNIIN
jgi:hypothetical protein